MIKIATFIRKQPRASGDYTTAYILVNELEAGEGRMVSVDNPKVFRKYIYDIAAKHNKEFTTKKRATGIEVFRLT